VSSPTRGNPISMGKSAGYEVRTYRYYDAATKGIDWKGMIEDLNVKLFFISSINCFPF